MDDREKIYRFLNTGTLGASCLAGQKVSSANEITELFGQLSAQGKEEQLIREICSSVREKQGERRIPYICVLAHCVQSTKQDVKRAALKGLASVCESPLDFFEFFHFYSEVCKPTRGWGRSVRGFVKEYYNAKDPMKLAEEVTRYCSHRGWSHADAIRLSHSKALTDGVLVIFQWLLKGLNGAKAVAEGKESCQEVLQFLEAVHTVKHSEDLVTVALLVDKHKLNKNHVLTSHLNSAQVWEALLHHASVPEILENIVKLAGLKLLEPGCSAAQTVIEKLRSAEANRRVAPLTYLVAMRNYESPSKSRHHNTRWTRNLELVEAFNLGLLHTIQVLPATGKRFLLGVKISNMPVKVRGNTALTPLVTASTLGLIAARTEEVCQLCVFSSIVTQLQLLPEHSLQEICETITSAAIAHTPYLDCFLEAPILWAKDNKIPVDVFVLQTDTKHSSQTEPAEALRQYRQAMDLPKTKLIIIGINAGSLSYADPNDPGMLDIVGFDTSVPDVIRSFARGCDI